MHEGVARLYLRRLAQVSDRLVMTTCRVERIPEACLRLGVDRLEVQGLLVEADRFVQSAGMSLRMFARSKWASAFEGFRRRASRYWAMASSRPPGDRESAKASP